MIALIDLDIIRYKVGFASETHYYDIYAKGDEDQGRLASFETAKERDEWIKQYIGSKDDVTIDERWIPDSLENCLHSVKLQLEFILSRARADEYRGFLTGSGNFRESLVDYYKFSRRDNRKPTYYEEIGKYLINHWNAEVVDGQEADDALGIHQYEEYKKAPKYHPEAFKDQQTSIICTIDKDLDNVPGWHFNFDKDLMYWVDEDEALRNFYSQLLTGDPSDDIPGLYKLTGRKCSKAILEGIAYCETELDMWKYVLYQYSDALYSNNPEDTDPHFIKVAARDKLKEIGQLLWIRREHNQLWSPPDEKV